MTGAAASRRAMPLGDIARLGWPVLVAQLAGIGNGLIDTAMAGRLSPADLAAVGLGTSVYVSVYIGLMGTLVALSPIVARHLGAQRPDEIAADVHQGLWVALALSALGCTLISQTGLWMAFADPPADVRPIASAYLLAIAAGLPAALFFRVFYATATALGRPRVVMALNLGTLALKAPLNLVFMDWLGGAGCAVSTAVLAWVSLAGALLVVHRMPPWRDLGIVPLRLPRPDWPRLREILRLGLPSGGAYLIEVTSFTFIALFVARFGATVAGSHQIVANLTGLSYMLPLSLGHATSVLAAQALGAGDAQRARHVAATGMLMGVGLALAMASTLWFGRDLIVAAFTDDPAVQAATLALFPLLACYHLFDATQCVAGALLRAWKVATVPMLIYALALWGVGLGGGAWLTFSLAPGAQPPSLLAGAGGFWVAGVASVLLAAVALVATLAYIAKRER